MYQITLNKNQKTISLKKIQQSITLTRAERNLKLYQTGRRGPTGADSTVPGPQGPAGPTGADGADGVVQSLVGGDNIEVDDTDPANPVISLIPKITVSATAPASPALNDIWIDTSV